MFRTDFSDCTKEERLSIIHLLIILLKGEQLVKKESKIWDYLPALDLTIDEFEAYIAATNQSEFETKMRLLNQNKIDIIIEEIHSLLWAEPRAKAMEYFIIIRIFEKITHTPKKHFFEMIDKYNVTEVYSEFKVLKLT